jgi:hypothetical protein
MKKFLLIGLLFLGFMTTAFAKPDPYTPRCLSLEVAADHKFLLQILKSKPTSGSYVTITKLVRNYKSGNFLGDGMDIYVRANYLYVAFDDGTEFEIYRRTGTCKV